MILRIECKSSEYKILPRLSSIWCTFLCWKNQSNF